MKIIRDETLSLEVRDDQPRVIRDYEFHNCYFDHCYLAAPSSPDRRTVIRNVHMNGCRHFLATLNGAVLDDVTVDNLGRRGQFPLFLNGVVLRHVRMMGKITFFKLNLTSTLQPSPNELKLWRDANIEFYRNVDWALDISKAMFTWLPGLEFVPGRLILRDPETQFLITREKAEKCDLSSPLLHKTVFGMMIEDFLHDQLHDEFVIVAAKKAKYFAEHLATLRTLREMRIAEPH